MAETYTLLVYSMIPEETIFVLIPASNLSKEDDLDLTRCNALVVNLDTMDAQQEASADRINQYIADLPYGPDGGRGKWFIHRMLEKDLPTIAAVGMNIVRVVSTGFLL